MNFPIPISILLILKVFGFFLHLLFMNIWVVGVPLGIILYRWRRKISERMFKVMPFFMAFGLNAGIVPLLFIQTIYPTFFYTATILQSWFWFSIIPLLIIAYYCIYLVYHGKFQLIFSFIAFLLLTWIGLIFSSVMSSITKSQQWFESVFLSSADAGSVYGIYLNLNLESLLRYGLVVGMAFGTVVTFLVLDTEFFAQDDEYISQVQSVLVALCLVGLLVYGVSAILYRNIVADKLSHLWFIIVGISFVIYVFFAFAYIKWQGKIMSILLFIGQFLVLLTNAIARQIVQFNGIKQQFDISSIPVKGEWGSFSLFVVALLLGIIVIIWIIKTIFRRVNSYQ